MALICRPSATTWRRAAILLAAALLLVAHAWSYRALVADDAFISLRYARRLLDGHGLTWTDGPPVEGYSNLLWVLGCAGLGALGMDLVHAARLLGLGAASALVAAVVVLAPRAGPRGWLSETASGLYLAVAAPIAVWAVGGLEAVLLAALVAWAAALALLELGVDHAHRPLLRGAQLRIALSSIVWGLACLTRPDAPLLAFSFCLFLGWLHPRRRAGVVMATILAVGPLLAVVGQTIFRMAYYDDFIPNTARAKVALHSARLTAGLDGITDFVSSAWPLLLPALGAVVVVRKDPRYKVRILTLIGVVGTWMTYNVAVAFDELAYRSLVPLFGLLAMLAAATFARASAAGRRAGSWTALAMVLLVALFGWLMRRDRNVAIARHPAPEVTQRLAPIGIFFRQAFGAEAPLLAVDAAGALPYYSGLPSLDMLGLCDRHIARHRPPEFGEGLAGHELGDGAYLLARAPDLIFPGVFGGRLPGYRTGKQLRHDARFADEYRPIWFRVERPALGFWAVVRLEGRIGLRRSGQRLTIPGHLFASGSGAAARLDATGRIGCALEAGASAWLRSVPLAAGRWRVALERARGEVSVRVSPRLGAETASADDSNDTIVVPPGAGRMDLELAADASSDSFVYGLELRAE